jgi:asparagine synthase (glutamine-hydrolysing)
MGFGVPVSTWLRRPLRQWACDLLSPTTLRRSGLLSEQPIQQPLAEHLSGARDRTQQLWTALMFTSWFEEQALV